jgi:hypothetical protein
VFYTIHDHGLAVTCISFKVVNLVGTSRKALLSAAEPRLSRVDGSIVDLARSRPSLDLSLTLCTQTTARC